MTPPHHQPEILALHRGYVRTEDRPNLYDPWIDDESECVEDMLRFRSHEQIRDPAEGGRWQSFVRRACIAVALFAVVYFAVRGAF
jgi:hypothetical protein